MTTEPAQEACKECDDDGNTWPGTGRIPYPCDHAAIQSALDTHTNAVLDALAKGVEDAEVFVRRSGHEEVETVDRDDIVALIAKQRPKEPG